MLTPGGWTQALPLPTWLQQTTLPRGPFTSWPSSPQCGAFLERDAGESTTEGSAVVSFSISYTAQEELASSLAQAHAPQVLLK